MSVKMFAKTRAQNVSALLFIIVFIILPFGRIAAQNAGRNIKTKTDTILIASEPGYPPFCIVDEEGNADGFSVDLIKAAAEVMNLNIHIKVGPWAQIKQELVDGQIDALPLVGRSPEREEVFDFTFPYHTMNGAVFVRKGTKDIKILEDLKQKEIVVMRGNNAQEFVTRDSISHNIYATDTYDIAFQQLSEGKYDAVIAQKLMGLQLLNELGIDNIDVLDIELEGFSQDFSFAVQEGDKELLALLNEGLSIIVANGTYDELHKKWWTPIEEYSLSFQDKLLMLLPYIISIIIIIAIIAIFILEMQVKKRTRNLRKEIVIRKQTEKTLKASEEKYRSIFESFQNIYYRANNKGIITELSPSVFKISGYKPDELIGKPVINVYQNTADRICLLKALKESGKVTDYELKLITKDKKVKIGSLCSHVIVGKDGEIQGIEGVIRDITERKQAMEEIEQLAKFPAENPYPVLRISSEGKVIYFNKASEPLLKKWQYTKEKSLPSEWKQFIIKTFEENIIRTTEIEIENKTMSLTFTPIIEKHFVNVYGLDITERMKAEEELKINRERLKTANSILRHDITNDLTVIKSAVDIYRDEQDETMLDEIETRVWKSIETIQNQRDQLKFLESHAELDEYNLEEALHKVIKNYPDLKINITGTCTAYADNALYSVFDNIISNAVRHGKTTQLDIDIIPGKEHCEIRFKDYGTGVPDEIKDKIFDEGFHYGETGHTGIGLYIVQKTVEEYDGEVTVEDNKPHGAIFIIRMKKTIEGF